MCLFQQHVVRRWKKRPTGDWIGVLGGYLWIMKQEDNFLKYHVVEPCIKAEPTESPADKKAEIEDCSHYEQMLKDYFQLDVDLESLYQQWSLADPNFQKIAKNYVGVRMLRQDPVENLFAFICSSNNNIQRSVFLVVIIIPFMCVIIFPWNAIPRITGMVEKLCQNYGSQLLTHEDVTYYAFPPIEALSDEKVESKLRTLGFGYRAKFIQQSAAKILKNGGRDWLMSLRKVTYPEAKTALMTLPGIGAKVFEYLLAAV